MLANPKQVRIIAYAKIKTDRSLPSSQAAASAKAQDSADVEDLEIEMDLETDPVRAAEQLIHQNDLPDQRKPRAAGRCDIGIELRHDHVAQHAATTDSVIEAGVLAQLYTTGFLPEVWIPDELTQALRRQVNRRNQIVRQRSRLKSIIQSILHSHLIPSCPHRDLCGVRGRT